MTQAERVEAWIRANPGCTTMDLSLSLYPFVSNPRARISDLRAKGVDVVCVTREDGNKGYVVREPKPVTMGVPLSMDLA